MHDSTQSAEVVHGLPWSLTGQRYASTWPPQADTAHNPTNPTNSPRMLDPHVEPRCTIQKAHHARKRSTTRQQLAERACYARRLIEGKARASSPVQAGRKPVQALAAPTHPPPATTYGSGMSGGHGGEKVWTAQRVVTQSRSCSTRTSTGRPTVAMVPVSKASSPPR